MRDYAFSVESAGFRKSAQTNLKLGVAETVTEVVVLELGAITESVSVEANAVRVQVSDAQRLGMREYAARRGAGPSLALVTCSRSAHDRQATMSFTTRPSTSVKRKSRPLYRYVSLS